MAKLKFYADEHISHAVVKGLRARGVDIISCNEAEMRTATDFAHLSFAKKEDRVIITYDNDFLKLVSDGHPHAGIIFSHRPIPIGEMISTILLIHEVFEQEDMENSIEFI